MALCECAFVRGKILFQSLAHFSIVAEKNQVLEDAWAAGVGPSSTNVGVGGVLACVVPSGCGRKPGLGAAIAAASGGGY